MGPGRRALLLRGLIITLPALALFARMPSHPSILGVLNNAAHAPVFGVLAVAYFHLLLYHPALFSWRRYLAAFVLAVATGGVVELIQPMLGRGAEITDLVNDALGAIAALGVLAFIRSRKTLALLMAALAVVPVGWPVVDAAVASVIRAREFPVLLGGDPWPDRYFIRARGVEILRAEIPMPWRRVGDPPSLLVRTIGTRWPGVTHSEPYPDWRGRSKLMIDLTNPELQPLALTLRVHDRIHDNRAVDRFNLNLVLAASRRQTIVIPLEDIEQAPADRRIDLSRMAGLIIFGNGDPAMIGRQYYITRIWLD